TSGARLACTDSQCRLTLPTSGPRRQAARVRSCQTLGAMRALRESLRNTPRAVVAFSVLHLLIGIFFLCALIFMRCVDEPAPPGTYRLDGCSASYDQWREGHVLQLLVPIV